MSDNNLSKAMHGTYSKLNLGQLIELLKNKGYIEDYTTPIRTGYKDFNTEQFHFQYIIRFSDGEKWIVHSTTSIRTDRINIQQWNSYHIKQIKTDVTKSIIVYPDNISNKERSNALSYYQKIQNKELYSAIDAVVSQSGFYELVEKRFLKEKVVGQQKALQGLNFEEQIETILNDSKNLHKWVNGIKLETGLFYPIFENIVEYINISNTQNIKELKATRKIPLLNSGGNPKTDVLLEVIYNDNRICRYTFTLKRTSADWVSVHEYPINRFIEVLGILDQKLIRVLQRFQEVGGIRALGSEFTSYLTKELPKYNKKLALWVYGGIGGDGDPEIQWAKYIITYQNESNTFRICDLINYVDEILKVTDGHFGTPFKWTYPSGGLGKRVQLKGKII